MPKRIHYNRVMNEDFKYPPIHHWVNGQELVQSSGDTLVSLNPMDQSKLVQVTKASQDTVNQAVKAAHLAYLKNRDSGPGDREDWLLKTAELLKKRADLFIRLLIEETGSPISKAKREVSTALAVLKASAGAARQVCGRSYPTDVAGRISFSQRRPLGVVAGMTPFNVPLIKGIKHAAMPIATGNSVVLLPSEETPLVNSRIAELFADAGLPAGLFNVVYGSGAEIGDDLTAHPLVRFVGFTGSQKIGRHVQKLCGEHGKRVTLELGGKNPLVILQDADLKSAIGASVMGSFLFQGQICMSSSRIIVEKSIFQPFVDAFVSATRQVQCGDLDDPKTLVGPLINERQKARVQGHIGDAIDKGATLHCGNRWETNLLHPTVISNINPDMLIYHEETFGPVATIQMANSSEEALRLANELPFGLSASVFTSRLDLALEFADGLEAGMVHVNANTIQEESHIPFGGVKESGFGREGSQVGVDELTEWKWITLNR